MTIANGFFYSVLLLALWAAPGTLRAQQAQSPLPPVPVLPGANPNASPPQDEVSHRMNEQMALKRNDLRQQQIVSDSAHLLALAQKLNSDVSKSTKNTLSISVVKEANEIEKLAKSIKDKMRDGD
jgi:hypothetical protein